MHQRMYLCSADGQLAAHLPCNMHNAASFCSRPYREIFLGVATRYASGHRRSATQACTNDVYCRKKTTQRWAIVNFASSLSELCHALRSTRPHLHAGSKPPRETHFFMIRAIDLASRAQFWSAERAQAGARPLEAQVALAGLPMRIFRQQSRDIMP